MRRTRPIVGRADEWSHRREHRERTWWLGRPWRRLELLVTEHYYRGERCARTWDLSAHAGIRRLGLHGSLALGYSAGFDYSDEPNQ